VKHVTALRGCCLRSERARFSRSMDFGDVDDTVLNIPDARAAAHALIKEVDGMLSELQGKSHF
jgi:predicted nucleotidyltransferase component of viral defense system